MYFELTFFDFPAAMNFKELLGADLSISETSSLPEVKQTYFWILMQKSTKDRTRVKISKLHIYQEGKHCHYFYSYNLRYNAIFTFYYNFLDIVLCLLSKYLLKILFSLGNLTLLTHFPQMSIEQRLQGCPLQNKPNLLFMHEKQSRPWDTDGGKPWWGGNKVTYFQVQEKGPTSNSALVRAVLMCLTSSRVRLRVPSSPILLPFLFSSTTSSTSSSSLSEASSFLKEMLKTLN